MKRVINNFTEPTEEDLREMPEVNLMDPRARRNPYAARIAATGIPLPGEKKKKKRKGEGRR